MNDCPRGEIRDLLPELLHQRLEPPARAEVEEHVHGCADCRDELELLREMRAALAWAAPVVRTDRIVAAVPARMPARRSSWGNWRIAAAVTVMALGGSSYALLSGGERGVRDSLATAITPAVGTYTDGQTQPLPGARVTSGAAGAGGAPLGLAMTGQLAELTEAELQAFLLEIEELEALPLMDPDPVALPASTPLRLEAPV